MKTIYIESRASAIRNGRTTYYTDKPCKNGHKAYRYATSGSCSECINGSNRHARGDTAARYPHETNDERRFAIGQLIPVAICVYAEDVPFAREAAAALCLARFPCLSIADVTLNKPPQKWAAGVPRNHFLVPANDLDAIRAVENMLLDRHKPDFTRVRKIQADLTAVVNAGGSISDYFKNT